ncbi:MAG: protein translocase subunit SecD [Eubacteriales bacterium]
MTKRKSIISLIIIFIFIGVFGYWGIFGGSIGRYDFKSLGSTVKQGLDLQGGVYALYDAEKPEDMTNAEFDSKMSAAIEILRTRLDSQGYTEATIAREGSKRLRIEIPNVADSNEVLSIIGKPALLQFKDPDGNVIMEGDDIKYARAGYLDGSGNEAVIFFELKPSGTESFAEATTRLAPNNEIIYIILDGETISSPRVEDPILAGSGYIRGMADIYEAQNTAMLIESGALPLVFDQLEARTISATLGVNALDSSLLAGLIGIIALFIFLIFFYRLSGVVADISLAIYLLVVVYVIALFEIQLTLPGIAGIILGVGMAVDANVIIYERIKEEVRTGKTFRSAVDAGFRKAIWTILDANFTTFIAVVVLALFGTGQIKGFAYTLGIGIIVSVLTAVFISRWMLRILIGLNIKSSKWYFSGADPEKSSKVKDIKVMKNAKFFAAVSILVIIVGIVVLVMSGFNLGVDFTGGTILTVDVGQEFEASKIEAVVENYAGDFSVAVSEDTKAIIKLQDKDADAEEQNLVRKTILDEIALEYEGAQLESQDRVGPVAGKELTRNAFISVLIACVAMLLYIWARFKALSGISAGVAALVALVHDVAIMSAVVLILKVQVNSAFIAAILTIVGYSINDTIVVFDRIRENEKRMKGASLRRQLVDRSISETIVRSLNTSITTLFTITALYILGVASIKEFALPLIVGIISGTYSSIFIAAPFWVWVHKIADKRNRKYKA